MARVHIVTDSTADLPIGMVDAEDLDVTVVPLNVHFGGQSFRDKVDLTNDEFFRRLATSPSMPTTSQPAVGDFEAVYRELCQDGAPIYSLHIASQLSGTFQAATLAATSVASSNAVVQVVDSGTASLGLGLLVLAAARKARDGATVAEIAATVEQLANRVQLVWMLDTLDYLQRGGRIGKAQALFGSLLSIKPVLRLSQGEAVPLSRERTRARGMDAMVRIAASMRDVTAIGVIHSAAHADAVALAARLAPVLNPPHEVGSLMMADFGPVIGTHTGPGAVGFAALAGSG